MKKNDFFSLWLRAFSCTTTMTMLFTALMALMFNTTKTFAQTSGTPNEALEEKSTGRTVIRGVDDLYGIDPSKTYCTDNGTNETDGDKIVCLYNVGAKKFLSVGGMWGTQASLDVSPYSIYLFWNTDSETETFRLENKVKGSAKNAYIGIDTRYKQVFMDQSATERSIIRFEKAKGYSETNKVYLVKIGNIGYLTAYPDKNNLCHYQASIAAEGTPEYKNQKWKVITKNEYYKLIKVAPANMESAVDASFLIACPDFRVNDADALKWNIEGNNLPTDWVKYVRFGDGKMYKPYNKLTQTGSGAWENYTDETHQRDYGQYFYCYTKGLSNFHFYQDIKVHKAGWYLLRCNGFTTQVNSKDKKVSARLMMTVVKADGSIDNTVYSAATLNQLSVADAKQLMDKDDAGEGAGRAFFNGKYENQVQVCLDEKTLGIGTISETNPVTLRIGYYVDADCDLHPGDVTCVDNFKLLYAGPRRNPELILDEDKTELMYLTNAKDLYKNTVLHLNRTFNEGQWNSLILPVDLNFGQMKRTFGDDVKVAKLTSLENNVVIFKTVEPKQDSDVMVKAFDPYIVKPTALTDDKSPAYTAEKFYTCRTDDGEANNAYWLGADGKTESQKENDRFSLTISANHYDIIMVTLDRDSLVKHLNLSDANKTLYDERKYNEMDWDKVSWISQTRFSTGAKDGDLTCYGTLTKTYNEGGILKGRDDLHGDYIMREGKIVQVPNNKQYGLKGFRCWFEVKGSHPSGTASAPRLEIDGIIDDATAIDDLNSQPSLFTSRHKGISGVFNLDGQKVREGESTQNLPKGIYIVNGRKVVVR